MKPRKPFPDWVMEMLGWLILGAFLYWLISWIVDSI